MVRAVVRNLVIGREALGEYQPAKRDHNGKRVADGERRRGERLSGAVAGRPDRRHFHVMNRRGGRVCAPRGFARGGKPGITFRIDQFEPAVLSALAELDPREILDCDHGPDEVAELSARVARLDPPFDPAATALTYQVFLADILPHREVVEYVSRLSGYVATGEATDETVHMFHGIGGNGKGKFLGLYVDVLGDGEYAATVPAELVADSGGERHPTERVCMRGARLAVCEQTADGEALNAKGVKNLPGVVCAQRVCCGKPACHCARGPGHLAYHRFWREGGRLRKCYVRRADLATVRAACDARRQEYRELTEARQQ